MDAQALENAALDAAEAATSVDEIEQVRVEFLGRKSELKLALREVRDRETGMALNAIRERLEGAIDARAASLERTELDRRLAEERVDVTMPGTAIRRGHLHLITQIRREVEDIFLGLGLHGGRRPRGRDDPLQLRRAQLPAGASDPVAAADLFLDDETVLRTETSPSQIRTMEAQEPPVYIVTLGRVYRRDTPDATHTPTFHQIECLAVDEGITLGDLEGTLDYLLKALFGESRRTRFVTHHFPFTEPSLEALVSCHICDGSGCPVCRHSGWIEVGGSGWSTRTSSSSSATTPSAIRGSRSAGGSSASPCSGTASRISASSGATTRDSSGSSDARAALLAPRVRHVTRRRMRSQSGSLRRRCRWMRVSDVGVPDVDGNLGRFLVGRVLEVEAHPNADRLRVCQVDVGEGDARQIVCGAWNFEAGATVAVALPGAFLPIFDQPLDERELRGQTSAG